MQSAFRVGDSPEPDYRMEAIEGEWRNSGVEGDYRSIPAWGQPVDSWCYLFGAIGSGKTHRAVAMMRRYLEDRTVQEDGCPIWFTPKVRFVKAPLYLEAVKASYEDRSDYRAEVYADCDLLVLDDLGQEAASRWTCEQLFLLIDHRHSLNKPMIITSQLDMGSMIDRFAQYGGRQQADAILSRFARRFKVQLVEGGDRRIAMRDVA